MHFADISIVIWIAAFLQGALGALVFFGSRTRASRGFAITALSVTIWTFIIGFFISAGSVQDATFLVKAAYATGIIIAEAFFYFFLVYPDGKKPLIILKIFLAAIAAVFVYLSFFTDLIIADAYNIGGIVNWGWHFGAFYPVFMLIFFPFFIVGFSIMLYKGLRAQDRMVRKGSMIMFWGVFVLIGVPTLVNIILPQFGFFQLLWLGAILTITWVGFMAYAIVKYEALSIKVIAKRSFMYTVMVIVVGFVMIGVNYFNNYFASNYSGFPSWLLYLVSAMVVAGIGYFIWLKVKEDEFLKYEFVTIVTHKLRTPLTRVSWSVENLSKTNLSAEQKESTQIIRSSNASLIKLANTLLNLSDSDAVTYQMENIKFDEFIKDVATKLKPTFDEKQIHFHLDIQQNIPMIYGDKERLRYVFETLLNNASAYTPVQGKVAVSVSNDRRNVIFKITDSGIGIPKNEVSFVFNRFFRTTNARKADTEGVGVGLFISRVILEKQGGSISVQSEGEGKGTTFVVMLPGK